MSTTIEVILEGAKVTPELVNTARVNLKHSTPVLAYTSGEIRIEGENLIKKTTQITTLGSLKQRKIFLTNRIAEHQAELAELDALIPEVETVVTSEIAKLPA